MSADKKFVLIVETEPRIECEVVWNGHTVPDLVYFKGEPHPLIKVGKYLIPGDRYMFRRPFGVTRVTP